MQCAQHDCWCLLWALSEAQESCNIGTQQMLQKRLVSSVGCSTQQTTFSVVDKLIALSTLFALWEEGLHLQCASTASSQAGLRVIVHTIVVHKRQIFTESKESRHVKPAAAANKACHTASSCCRSVSVTAWKSWRRQSSRLRLQLTPSMKYARHAMIPS